MARLSRISAFTCVKAIHKTPGGQLAVLFAISTPHPKKKAQDTLGIWGETREEI